MTAFAVMLAVLAAVGYATGARWQHGAVHDPAGDLRLGVRGMWRLVRRCRWLAGLAALGCGAGLHACALGLAPLSVVQPIGVLALPIVVLLDSKQTGRRPSRPTAAVTLAVLACTAGVAGFVVLAARSATATLIRPAEQLVATQLVAIGVLTLAVIGLLTRGRTRCVAVTAGCAAAYGYVSVLVRAVAQRVGDGFLPFDIWPVLGIVVAMLVGGWLLQHGYASGPPGLVVACLTVIDPVVALGFGIGLVGEADRVGAWTAVAAAGCAVLACLGVLVLARFHPHNTGTRDPTRDVRRPTLSARSR